MRWVCVFVAGSVIQKQLACILGRQQVFFELADDDSELMDLMRNSSLNTHFINLAREVGLSTSLFHASSHDQIICLIRFSAAEFIAGCDTNCS